jgi:TetR/AcrR family tetracycline transcriptional repressor
MTDQGNSLPPPPWWSSRESRKAARDERRRIHHEVRDAVRAVKKETPPRDPITSERLADAALRLIDAHGLDGLTVRGLAQELGLGTMTVYWYVQNKDEILDLVADRLVAGISISRSQADWRVSVRDGAIAVRTALLEHAQAVPILTGRGSFGPNGLRMMEDSIAVFLRAGFTPDDAADAYLTCSNFVTGFCTFETSAFSLRNRADLDVKQYGQQIRRYVESLPSTQYPSLQSAAARIFTASLDERFRFGLDCLIAGFEARLRAGKSGTAPEQSQEEARNGTR